MVVAARQVGNLRGLGGHSCSEEQAVVAAGGKYRAAIVQLLPDTMSVAIASP